MEVETITEGREPATTLIIALCSSKYEFQAAIESSELRESSVLFKECLLLAVNNMAQL
jgi:hypothetical protein